jgi:hypothetical protein
LAKDLGVNPPPTPGPPLTGIITGALCSIVGLTVLWFLIPLAAPIVDWATGDLPIENWPHDEKALRKSGIALLANVVPILMAVFIVVMFPLPAQDENGTKPSIGALLDQYSGRLLAIMGAVVVFDYLQTLSDFGLNNFKFDGTTLEFFLEWAPFNILHSLISLVVCLIILVHLVRTGPTSELGPVVRDYVILIATMAAISAFYAQARMYFQYNTPEAIDFLLLVVLLNMAAASIGFVVARSICQRRLAKTHHVSTLRRAATEAAAIFPVA